MTNNPLSNNLSTNEITTKSPCVLMMAAGTGGHVFPALSVAKELESRGAVIHWLGTPKGMENDLVKPTNYEFHAIDMMGLRGKGIRRLIKLPFTLTQAIMQSRNIIKQNNIDVVVGFGGYVTAPGGLAARMMGKPLLIHEQNAIAGMSNRYLAKLANKVMQAFDNTFSDASNKFVTVGNPVRSEITQIAEPSERFSVDTSVSNVSPIKLLVVGGSLGAQALNETVPAALALIDNTDRCIEVRHQCGKNNLEATESHYQQVDTNIHSYTVTPFIDNMAEAYAWADVVVCRAGALTVTEIQNIGLPAIFVPLPHAVDDHQTANACYLSDAGAAFLVPQKELTAEKLKDKLMSLDHATCLDMATKGKAQANPQSTKIVADIIWKYL